MNILRVSFLLCSITGVAGLANQPGAPAPAVVLSNVTLDAVTSTTASNTVTIDGVTYEEVRWGRLTPSTVTLYHKVGIATMPLAKLPPDLQKQFGYDPRKDADWQASVQKATTARLAAEHAAAESGKSEEQKAAVAKAEAEKQKALLVAHSTPTNAPPSKVQQPNNPPANRPTGGVTTDAILRRIQQNYGQPAK